MKNQKTLLQSFADSELVKKADKLKEQFGLNKYSELIRYLIVQEFRRQDNKKK